MIITPRRFSTALFALFLSLSCRSGAFAVSIDQFDDFEDETTAGWDGNVNGVVMNVATGGPAGAGDAFLLTAVTNISYHLGVKNEVQWTGDYLAAGIGAIEMDLNHLSPTVQEMRIRILVFGPGGPFASSIRTLALATNQWTHHVFGLTTNDLQYVMPLNCGPPPLPPGTGVLADTLADVTQIVIRNDRQVPTSPKCHPPHVNAIVGIDNIRAVPRSPLIDAFAYDGTNATVGITQLAIGASNVVQTADQLSPDVWSNAVGFTASTEATNVTLSTTQRLFRVHIP